MKNFIERIYFIPYQDAENVTAKVDNYELKLTKLKDADEELNALYVYEPLIPIEIHIENDVVPCNIVIGNSTTCFHLSTRRRIAPCMVAFPEEVKQCAHRTGDLGMSGGMIEMHFALPLIIDDNV